MSQSTPRRAAPQDAPRPVSKSSSPAAAAAVSVRLEKDATLDKRCETNGAAHKEAQVATRDANGKAETKQKADVNGDKHTKGAATARQEGADIPPNIKQHSKQPEANDDAHKLEKKHTDKEPADKEENHNAKKQDKLATKKEEKLASKKEDKLASKKEDKLASKEEDKLALKEEDKLASKQEDKLASKQEDKQPATNGDASTPPPQESGARRKPDTNYSVSRVKISPYRRGATPHDHADCSMQANYTGNNSTMECSLSESSRSETPLGGGLCGLRSVRGRASYRALGELSLSTCSRDDGVSSRPTAPVVGRKRAATAAAHTHTHTLPQQQPLVKRPRTHTQVVGVNSDLPLCGPAGTELESLKPTTTSTGAGGGRDRRCRIM